MGEVLTKSGIETAYWLTLSQLEGHMAMWAVRQSPYHNPEKLDVVLPKFREILKPYFDKNEMAKMTKSQIESAFRDSLMTIPEFTTWNERKNGNKSPFGFVSQYDKPSPDNDFIDLDALIRNCTVSLWKELETD